MNHPIVLTETVCNPSESRSGEQAAETWGSSVGAVVSEMLFEGYQVPSVCYGVDSMFSMFYNYDGKGLVLCLSVSVSNACRSTGPGPSVVVRLSWVLCAASAGRSHGRLEWQKVLKLNMRDAVYRNLNSELTSVATMPSTSC